MKIETASLERGAPVRRVVYDDARAESTDNPKPTSPTSPSGPWAWAAALARYTFGYEQQQPESTTPEIETR